MQTPFHVTGPTAAAGVHGVLQHTTDLRRQTVLTVVHRREVIPTEEILQETFAPGAAPTAVIRGPIATVLQDIEVPVVDHRAIEVQEAVPQGTAVPVAELLRGVQDTAVPVAALHHGVQVLAGAQVAAHAALDLAEVPEAQV